MPKGNCCFKLQAITVERPSDDINQTEKEEN